MAWTDRLLRGSFRGVPFEIAEEESTPAGRRVARHQYPGGDEPYAEDLGRLAREFAVRGYLVGDDYQILREALRAACDLPGPGTLVHPYLGVQRVACVEFRTGHSTSEGRMCRVEMRFVEAGRSLFPLSIANAASALAGAAAAAAGAVAARFAGRFGV